MNLTLSFLITVSVDVLLPKRFFVLQASLLPLLGAEEKKTRPTSATGSPRVRAAFPTEVSRAKMLTTSATRRLLSIAQSPLQLLDPEQDHVVGSEFKG